MTRLTRTTLMNCLHALLPLALSALLVAPTMAAETLPVPGKPTLVEITLPYCPPCKQMVPVMKNIKAEYGNRVEIRVLDMREHRALAKEWDVHIVPTLLFFDAQGEEVSAHVGFLSEEDVKKEIEEIL